ncbi:MAG: AraC family transcriptional regulator [Clostridia bacterium]|nr:AraC family transcriptional regulator [Clostridia bacterium]
MSFYEREAEESHYFYFVQRKEYETAPHFHSALEFHFVEEGEQEIIVDGEKRIMRAGDACFCDSFSVHQLRSFFGKSAFCLLADKYYFDGAFIPFDDRIPPTFFRFENFALLRELYRFCNKNRANSGGMHSIFGGAIKLLLGEISQTTPFVPRRTNKKNLLVCDVLRYADEHAESNLSLAHVANVFGYSHEHLSHILHECLRENWNTYVNRLRARNADTLLRKNPDLSVLSIALTCGFDSANTFYRAYKKEFGVPPRRNF